jgi:surfactin family lipopeptide synthetase A
VFEDQQLTYRELNARANQLAHHLRKLGVGPEVLVGICIERSLEMLVGLLGILKAGGAYVPLEPEYPGERLSFMLEDTKAPVLLTQEHLRTKIPEHKAETIFLDSCWEVIAKENQENLSNETSTENLAYVMYTSGATGKPKGVMISHHNVVGFLHSFKQVTLEGEKRIGTSVATFSFDVSVEEIFSTLCFGGTVHLVSPECSTNVEYFANYLVDNHITMTYILPDLLRGVASHLEDMTDRMNLKCVITGLAPKKESLLQSIRNVSDQIRILNAYGPTEVTYGATAFEFLWANKPDRDVPIGRPFPNYEVYIVNSNLQPVPIGVVGELLIGGVGLARGYLNRPELTAEKFIPHPFSDKPGARVYKTGDLCRFLPDGNIDFIGRFDYQVKIRGFRIELGEIETVLKQHSDVKNTVVLAREDRPGDKRLVAYVVQKQGTVLTIHELHNFLKEKLPNYMVPSNFVFLDALPLTPNGKVDRNALPVPDTTRPDLEETYMAPRTPVEKTLSEIWAEVLGLEKMGIHDNFFELGGHSLLATRVVSRLRNAFRVELLLRSFFESPTIAEMALVITQKQAEKVDQEEIERMLDELEALSD